MYEQDRELIRRMMAGDERAFHAFFDTYASRLAAFAARRSAFPPDALEDVVQDTLIKAVRKLPAFRGDASLFTWLCQICIYELVDLHRKSVRREAHDQRHFMECDTFDGDLRCETADPMQVLQTREHCIAVVKALKRLPEQYSRALEWKYGDGLTVEEIGQILGLSTAAAQSLLQRARLAFRQSWGHPVAAVRAASGRSALTLTGS